MTGNKFIESEKPEIIRTHVAVPEESADSMAKAVIKDTINKVLLASVAVFAFGLPLIVDSPTWLHIIVLIYFYAYLTTSWNMVGGFAGVLPLGHAVFIGIGAYSSTILSLQYGVSPWIGMMIGGAIAIVAGVLIGLPTFKMRGAYFALATIAFAEGFRVMVENIDYLGPLKVNGPRGLQIPPLNMGLANFMFAGKEPYYYIILLMLIAVLTLDMVYLQIQAGILPECRRGRARGRHGPGCECIAGQIGGHGHEFVSYRPGRHFLCSVLAFYSSP